MDANSGSRGRGWIGRREKVQQKVEFATLHDFLEEIADSRIETVRVDVFEDMRQSELSFVHYVSLTMFVTAQDSTGFLLYEYKEPIATIATTDHTFRDETFLELAEKRRKETEQVFRTASIPVRRGRFTYLPYVASRQTPAVIEAPFPANPMTH